MHLKEKKIFHRSNTTTTKALSSSCSFAKIDMRDVK